MSTAASVKVTMSRTSAGEKVTTPGNSARSALAEFEQLYRGNTDVVMAYFARRCAEPQAVADLTSETFVRAAGAFGSFDPGKGTGRAWLFGIAGHVYAQHCTQTADGRDAAVRLAGIAALEIDEIDELAARIDAERNGKALIERCSQLPALERAAVELVTCRDLHQGGRGGARRLSRRTAQTAVSGADTDYERSITAMSKFTDRLWREIVRERGRPRAAERSDRPANAAAAAAAARRHHPWACGNRGGPRGRAQRDEHGPRVRSHEQS